MANHDFIKVSPRTESVVRLRSLHQKITAKNAPLPEGTEPGTPVPGQGVYLGRYDPIDRDGNSLSRVFNVFAAPEDLPGCMTYPDVVQAVAQLKNWHGHDGTNYATDAALYADLRSGRYDGGWIIPPADLLHGGEGAAADNLFKHRDQGALKDTFKTTGGHPEKTNHYWGSTESPQYPDLMAYLIFPEGYRGASKGDLTQGSCRPVRLVPAP